MGMESAEHIADRGGAFAVGFIRREALCEHRVEDTPMDRLETVSDIRECAVCDDAHRVIDERFFHLFFKINRDDRGLRVAERGVHREFLLFLKLLLVQALRALEPCV